MKRTLERLVTAGKAITNSVKKHATIGLAGFALASPFLFVNKATASQGEIVLEYIIGIPYTNSNWALVHHSGVEEDLDDHDSTYFPMFNSSGVASKITSTVEGKEIDSDIRPEFSTSSVNFAYTVITEDGSPVPQINNPYLSVWTNGFEGEDVAITVEGVTYDARTVGTIPLTNLTGTGTINFSKPSDPNNTDPNEVERVSGTLRIDNVHEKSPTSTFLLVHEVGASDEPNDSGDIEYVIQGDVTPPYLASQVPNSEGEYKYLTTDKRHPDTSAPVFLQQRIHSDYGFARISGGDTNALIFSIPEDTPTNPTNQKFGTKPIKFQEIYRTDPNDPNFYEEGSPILVKDLINQDPNELGVYLLPDLERKIPSGKIEEFKIEFYPTRELAMADFNEDGIVDVNDRLMLEGYLGYEGTSRYDIASLKDPLAEPNTPNYGLISIGTTPDYIVDSTDKIAFEEMMIADEKRRGVYDPNSE